VRERDERWPRPKSQETASRGSGALIALLVVGGIVLLGGGVLAVVLLVGPGKSGPEGGAGRADGPAGEEAGARIPEPLLAYLPNDTFKIEYANLKAQREEFGNDKRRYHVPGFKVEQLEDYLGSLEPAEGTLQAYSQKGILATLSTSKPLDQKKIVAGGTELNLGGKPYHRLERQGQFPTFIYFPSGTVLIQTINEPLMKEVLGGSVGKLAPPLPEYCAKPAGHLVTISKVKDGTVCRLERSTWVGDERHFYWDIEYANEQEAARGREYYDELARKARHPNARMTVEVNRNHIVVRAHGPATALANGW
jgi:hypothetical protein